MTCLYKINEQNPNQKKGIDRFNNLFYQDGGLIIYPNRHSLCYRLWRAQCTRGGKSLSMKDLGNPGEEQSFLSFCYDLKQYQWMQK